MPRQGEIRIGTSGWNYKHWRGPFYPQDLPQKKWLEFYAEHFTSVEINNSFYQLPKESTFRGWADTVPSDFVFAVKASRYITHMKKLKDPRESLGRFVDRAAILGDRLGPILFQLPPWWHANPERLKAFLEELDSRASGGGGLHGGDSRRGGGSRGALRCAFEFRDETWFSDDVLELLKAHGAAFCIYQIAGRLSPKEVTADFVYVRLHGPTERKYEGSYDSQTLAGWAGAFSSWRSKGLDVYCYFDNDDSGYAAENAASLADMLR